MALQKLNHTYAEALKVSSLNVDGSLNTASLSIVSTSRFVKSLIIKSPFTQLVSGNYVLAENAIEIQDNSGNPLTQLGAYGNINLAVLGVIPITIEAYRNSVQGASINLTHSRSPMYGTAQRLEAGDYLGTLFFRGSDGTGAATFTLPTAAYIGAQAESAFTPLTQQTYLTFGTTPLGSTTVQERMRIDGAGNVGIGSAASGSYILDVQRTGAGSSTGARIYNSATAAGSGSRFDFQQGSVNTFIDSVSNATGRVGTSTAHPFSIYTNNTERLAITQLGTVKFIASLAEAVTVSATAASTTVTYDVLTNKNVLYYTAASTANWTFNVRGNAGTTLNTLMDIGQSLTVVFMATNTATPFYSTAFQIDGVSVTPKWPNGIAPSAGNANSIDTYTYNIIKTAASTYTVLASLSRFA